MRRLPLGVPKLMVSTLASGPVRPYVGGKDILMLNSVVDISGINRISRTVLTEAAMAMALVDLAMRSDVAAEGCHAFVTDQKDIQDAEDRATLCKVEATRVDMETF